MVEMSEDATTRGLFDTIHGWGKGSVLVVFTGGLADSDAVALASLRPVFKIIVVAALSGAQALDTRRLPPGISAVAASTLEEFALQWDRLRR